MTFVLDPRLADDTIALGALDLSSVLLMNDRRFPWIILVPQRQSIRELIELARDEQIMLLDEIATASRVLTDIFSPDKLNVAALGNMVPQLHVHIIARYTTDAAWPAPVWGVGDPVRYTTEDATAHVTRLATALGVSA